MCKKIQSNQPPQIANFYGCAANGLVITGVVVAILGILAACKIHGLNAIHPHWYYFEVGAAVSFVLAFLICQKKMRTARPKKPPINEVKKSEVRAPTEEVTKPASRPEVIPPLSLQWKNFYENHLPALASLPLHLIEPIEIETLLMWTESSETKELLKQRIKDLKEDSNLSLGINDGIAKMMLRGSGKEWQIPLQYQEVRDYLKNIIYLVQQEEKKHDCQELKKYIISELDVAFKQGFPTWRRVAEQLYRMMQLRFHKTERMSESMLRMQFPQMIQDYKEVVIVQALQSGPEIVPKGKEWDFLSCFVDRLGARLGMTSRQDLIYNPSWYAKILESRTDEQWMEWICPQFSVEGFINYVIKRIDSGSILYKDLEGHNHFLSYVQQNLSEKDSINRYFDQSKKPNRQAIQFILMQLGFI